MADTGGRFGPVYDRLKAILEPYATRTHVAGETATSYALDLAPPEERTPATWFAGVRLGKRYVSYYLMPVYTDPSLLDGVSPALRKRMQGKSCFNLASLDEALIAELTSLTERGYERTAGDPEWGKRVRAGWNAARSNR